jgi:hypothetical protein
MVSFRSTVEPPEPMRGLEVPAEVVTGLDGGARPRVVVTLGGHSWPTTIAILRGRHLIGVSHANRRAAGVEIGDEVDVEVVLDPSPRTVEVPDDLAEALDADPEVRAAFDRLAPSHRRAHVRSVEIAKKPETRVRRITAVVDAMTDPT